MPRLLSPEEAKLAFSTNAYSGPMGPVFMKMESHLPASKIPIAQASHAGVAGTGGGSAPTRGGFLMASRQEAPIVPLRKQAEKLTARDKDVYDRRPDMRGKMIGRLEGDEIIYRKILQTFKEKDSAGMPDENYWPYKPGDFKPAKLASGVEQALLRAFDHYVMAKTALSTPQATLQKAQQIGKTPNQLGNIGTSIRMTAKPEGLTNIATVPSAPVAAVDKAGKI